MEHSVGTPKYKYERIVFINRLRVWSMFQAHVWSFRKTYNSFPSVILALQSKLTIVHGKKRSKWFTVHFVAADLYKRFAAPKKQANFHTHLRLPAAYFSLELAPQPMHQLRPWLPKISEDGNQTIPATLQGKLLNKDPNPICCQSIAQWKFCKIQEPRVWTKCKSSDSRDSNDEW